MTSVEIRDVTIPAQLQDAMSREAQAEREKAARVILGSAIYETTKERGTTVLIPTSMVDSMNAGAVMGITAGARQGADPAPQPLKETTS